MKLEKLFLFPLLFISMVLSSCKKEDEHSGGSWQNQPYSSVLDPYLFEAPSYWVYRYEDSNAVLTEDSIFVIKIEPNNFSFHQGRDGFTFRGYCMTTQNIAGSQSNTWMVFNIITLCQSPFCEIYQDRVDTSTVNNYSLKYINYFNTLTIDLATYNKVRVFSHKEYNTGIQYYCWFAPNVGMIKEEHWRGTKKLYMQTLLRHSITMFVP